MKLRQRHVLVGLLFFHSVNTIMDRVAISSAKSSPPLLRATRGGVSAAGPSAGGSERGLDVGSLEGRQCHHGPAAQLRSPAVPPAWFTACAAT